MKAGGSQFTCCVEASRRAGAFTDFIASSLTLTKRGRDAALIAVGSLGYSVLTGDESLLKRYFVCVTVMRWVIAMKLVFRGCWVNRKVKLMTFPFLDYFLMSMRSKCEHSF